MKIAIDCRYLGKSGIGRVNEGLLDALDYSAEEYYLIGDRRKLEKYPAAIVEDQSEPYSFSGLRSYDRALNQLCDVYFTPNFLIPFGIKIPVHAVIHDLAFLDVKETTSGIVDKTIKKILLKRCIKRATSIACVSEFTEKRCKHYYGKLADKCYVNHIAVSEDVYRYSQEHPHTPKSNKIVFVGNVKEHKGLRLLLEAFSQRKGSTILKIIGERETFRISLSLDDKAYPGVEFTGKLKDEDLFYEMASAKYLVLPSKYEGFGLPPLEALCLGTQPIVSDLEVFHEVYAGLPVKFFSTPSQLVEMINSEPNEISCREKIKERYSFSYFSESLLKHLKG